MAEWMRSAVLPCCVGVAAVTVGCAGYEPAQPGEYAGIGKVKSDLTCVYEAPTGNLVSAWRCKRTEDLPEDERRAREMLDRIRVAPVTDPALLRQ